MLNNIFYINVSYAINYGFQEAAILSHIIYWISKNKISNRNLHDGRTWTYNSIKTFTTLFPYWTDKKIRSMMNKLVEKGVLITGNYNKSSYDRTMWYALYDEEGFLSEQSLPTKRYRGYIYIIKDDSGKVKIGRSGSVKVRLRSYKNIEIVATYNTDDMVHDEKKLHEMFKNKKVCEWFLLDDEDIKKISSYQFSRIEDHELNNIHLPQRDNDINSTDNNQEEDPVRVVLKNIFSYWNSKECLITHRVLSDGMKKNIQGRLKEYSADQLKESIDNYSTVLSGEKYFYSYKHGIDDFFRSGQQKPSPFIKFLNERDPLHNFLIDNHTGGANGADLDSRSPEAPLSITTLISSTMRVMGPETDFEYPPEEERGVWEEIHSHIRKGNGRECGLEAAKEVVRKYWESKI